MIHSSPLLETATPVCTHGFFEMTNKDGATQNAAFIPDESFEEVNARRGRMIERIGLSPQPVMSMKQIHSNKVITVTENWERGKGPQADGFVTKERGIVLGILTADCGPLLFLDPTHRIIGACHAGWKGAISGIIENTLRAMGNLGADRSQIRAVLGPTIKQHSYEVGPEFPLQALTTPYVYSQFFKPAKREGHHMFDLPAYLRVRLANNEIQQFQDLNLNTYSGNFFSRRRCVAEKQVYDKKANLSAIALL